MERAAFLIGETGERVSCLLNPESLLVRRAAGLSPRRSLGGPATGEGLTDDPLVFTGGGSTELLLNLLFDVYVAGSSIPSEDVRDLTGPLWRLAETARGEGWGRLPQVRFLWGKAWNVPGVVADIAERLERFTPGGVPTRSWLRMRLLRTGEAAREEIPGATLPQGVVTVPPAESVPDDRVQTYAVLGGALSEGAEGAAGGEAAAGQAGEAAAGERLDQIAARFYGDPRWWTVLAAFNRIDDPFHLVPGTVLLIPDASLVRGAP